MTTLGTYKSIERFGVTASIFKKGDSVIVPHNGEEDGKIIDGPWQDTKQGEFYRVRLTTGIRGAWPTKQIRSKPSAQIKAYARLADTAATFLDVTEEEKSRVVKAWKLGNLNQRSYNINPYTGSAVSPPKNLMLWLVTSMKTGSQYLVAAESATKLSTAVFFGKLKAGT